ncbi:MAG: S4 domain-containing protein [Bacilli bacterium]
MRIDLFLKKTMIVKRRVVAQELVSSGKILLNKKIVKPSAEVKTNDIISINIPGREKEYVASIELRKDKEVPSFKEND